MRIFVNTFLWLASDSLYLHQTFESRGLPSDLCLFGGAGVSPSNTMLHLLLYVGTYSFFFLMPQRKCHC